MKIECLPGQKLTDSECSVLKYIENQQCIIELLSLEDIAKGAFVSNATVSRTIRKCGFSSFSEMKYRVSEDRKQHAQSQEMNRVLSKSYTECVETIKRIDIAAVLKIV
jgi:DNA-binding MurR/RpiR family transcriptional regulator